MKILLNILKAVKLVECVYKALYTGVDILNMYAIIVVEKVVPPVDGVALSFVAEDFDALGVARF